MLRKILLAVGVLIVGFLLVVVMQPEEFSVSRSTDVAAPQADVFALVNDFHRWQEWSPWEKLDPTMKKIFEGPAYGEGSAYSWSGNKEVGEGKMTIVKSEAFERILIKLEFLKPMVATNMTEFTFIPKGQGTVLTWTMSGKNTFISKAFHLVMNLEKMIGPDFDQGLADIKKIAERSKK